MRKDFMPSMQKKIAFIKTYIRIFRLNKVKRGLALESNFYVNPKYRVAYYMIPKVLSSSLCRLMLQDAGIDFEEGLGHKKHQECFDYRLTLGGGGMTLPLPLSVTLLLDSYPYIKIRLFAKGHSKNRQFIIIT